jgi:hypothetical protein
MEDFFKHTGVLILGIVGFIFSYIFDNEEVIFKVFRWLAVLIPTLYTIWKWRKDIKDGKK